MFHHNNRIKQICCYLVFPIVILILISIPASAQQLSEASAYVEINAGPLDGSTFGLNSYQIDNTSTSANITQITFDLSSAIIAEVAFDPFGTGGDIQARDLTLNGDDGGTGYTGHSFSQAYEGGFYQVDITFDDFDPGETVEFGLDIDPISIKGGTSPGPNSSGKVSGIEVIGSHVSIEYDTGEVQTVQLYRKQENSQGASENLVQNILPASPQIEVIGVPTQSTVSSAAQTVRISGSSGDQVTLLHLEAGLFVEDLTGPYAGIGYSLDPWEVNSVIAINEADGVIGEDGMLDINITLTDGDPEAGYNIFAAVVVGAGGETSDLSNVVIVEYDVSFNGGNRPPVAQNDSQSTVQETPITINVLANDSDPDNTPLSVDPVSLIQPVNGSAAIQNDQILYTPNNGFIGQDSFTYQATDGLLNSNTATVTITVTSETTCISTSLGDLNRGIAGYDAATGSGYLMYSAEILRERFTSNRPNINAAEQLIMVRYNNGQWEYDANTDYVPFTPQASDILLAEVNFSSDVINMLAGVDESINGISAGYAQSDLIVTPNQWNGIPNNGEFGLSGSFFEHCDGDSGGGGECTTIPLGDLKRGIAAFDPATGSGYVMFSEQILRERFTTNKPNGGAAEHLIIVRDNAGTWEYDANTTYVPFTPRATDILLAEVDFDTDIVNMLAGIDTGINGITAGYDQSDLVVTPNRWNGAPNNGEYGLSGSFFERNCNGGGGGSDSCPLPLGALKRGMAAYDSATGSGYIMYSGEVLRERFSSNKPNVNAAERFIPVRLNNGQWEYDANDGYYPFIPAVGDFLVASVDFSTDTIGMLLGQDFSVEGIPAGYSAGDIQIIPNQWNGSANAGEFGITGSTIERCSD